MKTTVFGVLVALATLIPSTAPAQTKAPTVEFKTSSGTFKIELYPDKAPVTVKNFLQYVDEKFYDGTIFHRVISDFVIQGGGFDRGMQKKATRDPITNEAANGLKNAEGTLSMARTREPNSATSQFFVNLKDNSALDYKDGSTMGIGYCVFAKVISGMDVVKKIAAVQTGTRGGMNDVPMEPVVVEFARQLK